VILLTQGQKSVELPRAGREKRDLCAAHGGCACDRPFACLMVVDPQQRDAQRTGGARLAVSGHETDTRCHGAIGRANLRFRNRLQGAESVTFSTIVLRPLSASLPFSLFANSAGHGTSTTRFTSRR
jgi:hypothetical protein